MQRRGLFLLSFVIRVTIGSGLTNLGGEGLVDTYAIFIESYINYLYFWIKLIHINITRCLKNEHISIVVIIAKTNWRIGGTYNCRMKSKSSLSAFHTLSPCFYTNSPAASSVPFNVGGERRASHTPRLLINVQGGGRENPFFEVLGRAQ